MKKSIWLLLAAAVLATPACGGKQVIHVADSAPPKDGVVSVRFASITVKAKKYNAQLVVTNATRQSVLFYMTDMHCFRGSVEGTVKHEMFGIGHRTFKFHPGATESYTMVCDFHEPVEGDFRFTIARIYDNPNGDGITQGQLLGENFESTQAQGTKQ